MGTAAGKHIAYMNDGCWDWEQGPRTGGEASEEDVSVIRRRER